ncbi:MULTISPECIES: aspartate/glutamate racemase family protein [Rhizobium]|uniref:aspartate/glutamate racemase family protein n=1 Tax=Rhizobium TaxID=379 RepID=UPI001FEF306A|nr:MULTISPECIES: aspartate/glutamate racemase family protein [Rhizobium]
MRIACLHTADSNIAVFEAAAREIGLSKDVLSHAVRADFLANAEQAGGLTDDIARETASVLRSLGQTADAVVLTCSTLGPSIDELEGTMPVPTLRIDAVLAEQAVRVGGRIAVLCAVETTLEPTARLFAAATAATQTPFEVRRVPGAWDLFKAGDRVGYLSAVAEAADAAYREGASIVALARHRWQVLRIW